MAKKRTRELKPRQLRKTCDPATFKFKTTAELEPFDGVIEQRRAVDALDLGLTLQKRNYNVYVAGASGTGKTTIARSMLAKLATERSIPDDWVYLHNFRNKEAPQAVWLKPGKGSQLRADMVELVQGLTLDLPKAFQSKAHQEQVQDVVSESIEKEHELFSELSRKASDHGFVVKSTKSGIVTIPMLGEKILSNKDYEGLSDVDRRDIEGRRKRLDPAVNEFLQKARRLEARTQRSVRKIQMQLGRAVISAPANRIKRRYARLGQQPKLRTWFTEVSKFVLDNLALFLPQEAQEMPDPTEMSEFKVNVVVDNGDTAGAPVISEPRPTFYNLFGRIEKKVENGIYFTDFTMIKAGSVLRANGGYLIIQAHDLFMYPLVWENLKSILRYKAITIEDIGETMGFLPTSGLRPEPIPIELKVILVGPYYAYEVLHRYDEDFRKLFQVVAEFDSEMRRTAKTMEEYARFIATTCKREGLRAVDPEGAAAVVEYGGRLVESQRHVTLQFNEVCNLLIEADHFASKRRSRVIRRTHVEQASKARDYHRGLFQEKIAEQYRDEMILMDTKGERIGVVNGLAVYQMGDHAFGKAARITASVFAGRAGVINIEREVRLSGPLHSKGVLIISGFLGDRFARTRALSMTVSLVFEQSYGMVDGDSASCAELYATLSALARVPLRQDLAVTGSVNQLGQVQPIGGVNEKVEAWFRLCKERGLTGDQGVMIPIQNVQNLMLADDVVEAVEAGKFHVYPIETIEEGIELLSGMAAGEVDAENGYTKGSLYELCLFHLDLFDDEPPATPEEGDDKGNGNGTPEKRGPADPPLPADPPEPPEPPAP
jgi:predicted ATP-dependent protease